MASLLGPGVGDLAEGSTRLMHEVRRHQIEVGWAPPLISATNTLTMVRARRLRNPLLLLRLAGCLLYKRQRREA